MIRQEQAKKENKGFTLHIGDTYIGFVTISDKLNEATQNGLQTVEGMKAVLEKAEFRPYQSKVENSELNNILASAGQTSLVK